MPLIRHGQDCDCCAPGAAGQALDEVAFAKSAAAAALAGDYFRVKQLVARNPAALHQDGAGGEAKGPTRARAGWQSGRVDAPACRAALCAGRPTARRPPANSAPARLRRPPAGASGYTPLHYAAREGHLDVCELLLSLGADVNATTTSGGATALHRAAFTGQLRIVQLLLQAGAAPAAQDTDGQTALHKAEQQGHAAVAAALRAACPSLNGVADARGRLPADLRQPG